MRPTAVIYDTGRKIVVNERLSGVRAAVGRGGNAMLCLFVLNFYNELLQRDYRENFRVFLVCISEPELFKSFANELLTTQVRLIIDEEDAKFSYPSI